MVPDVPGCIATADTLDKVRTLIAKALAGHLQVMRENGESIPKPAKRLSVAIDDLEDGEYVTWVEVPLIESTLRHLRTRKLVIKS